MDYSDIMDMDKPISHHKPMDITHRAKIFAPFAALKGFEDCIRQKEIVYEEYPVLSEEQKDRLDQEGTNDRNRICADRNLFCT